MKNESTTFVEYDYFLALILSPDTETLIGGKEDAVRQALKNRKNPNLKVKGLDVYYREMPLGTFAADVNQNAVRAEIITEQTDMFYTNLLNENSNAKRVADTKRNLEKLFRTDCSFAVRLLSRTLLVWYDAAKVAYMDGRKVADIKLVGKKIQIRGGLPLKQAERAELGEQFKTDVDALIENTFTVLKKKYPPSRTEDSGIIVKNAEDISELLAAYKQYMSVQKTYCICCKDCEQYFISKSWNTLYCADCKASRKKANKRVYLSRNSEGVRQERLRLQYSFENFMSKSSVWKRFTPDEQTEYKELHDEFVEKTHDLLRKLKKGEAVAEELQNYIDEVKKKKSEMELWVK